MVERLQRTKRAARKTNGRADNTLPRKKRGPGQPAHEPTQQLRDIVEGMSLANISPTQIAEIIKISEPTLRKHYAEQLMHTSTMLVQLAATKLREKLKAGDNGSIFFTLKTQGKKYGWSERHEVTGADGEPLMPKLENLTDEQLARLREAQRILASIAAETADRGGDQEA